MDRVIDLNLNHDFATPINGHYSNDDLKYDPTQRILRLLIKKNTIYSFIYYIFLLNNKSISLNFKRILIFTITIIITILTNNL